MRYSNKFIKYIRDGENNLGKICTWGLYKDLALYDKPIDDETRFKLISNMEVKMMEIAMWSCEKANRDKDTLDEFERRCVGLKKCILILKRKMIYSKKYSSDGHMYFWELKH